MALGEMLDGAFHGFAHDIGVGEEQVVAAHAGLARQPSGDDDDIRVGGGSVIVAATTLTSLPITGKAS